MNINENKPATKNQISNTKPKIEKSFDNILTGYIANSFNGGMIKPIAYKQVMAGEKIKEYKIQLKIKLLTPKTPTYQNLRCTIQTFFVPNSRIWENAEAYTAQKGGATVAKIEKIPSTKNKIIPYFILNMTDEPGYIENENTSYITNLTYTDLWRDSYISTYIPKLYKQAQRAISSQGYIDPSDVIGYTTIPDISILPLRGFKAIYNDFLRNKEYDEILIEYKNDEVSNEEWYSYLPIYADNSTGTYNNIEQYSKTILRGKKQNSYYTDYRTELQGFEEDAPDLTSETNDLLTWIKWEQLIAETRSEAENAQANDWDIIAKIRGSQKLTEGKVQLLGKRTFNLNYAAVTQNTYNQSVQDINFQVLGQQGAYSYTEVEIPCFAAREFKEEGYIHVIAQVSADEVNEKALERLEMNITPLDQYRPDLKNVKEDVLYEVETGTAWIDQWEGNLEKQLKQVRGFKRKFSEYFKLPNIIRGDMGNDTTFEIALSGENEGQLNTTDSGATKRIYPNSTHQFFMEDAKVMALNLTEGFISYQYTQINPWQDYTDLLINKNQAIINPAGKQGGINSKKQIIIREQNQIFFVGKCICINDMPIDEAIKTNFTKWGEH